MSKLRQERISPLSKIYEWSLESSSTTKKKQPIFLNLFQITIPTFSLFSAFEANTNGHSEIEIKIAVSIITVAVGEIETSREIINHYSKVSYALHIMSN